MRHARESGAGVDLIVAQAGAEDVLDLPHDERPAGVAGQEIRFDELWRVRQVEDVPAVATVERDELLEDGPGQLIDGASPRSGQPVVPRIAVDDDRRCRPSRRR